MMNELELHKAFEKIVSDPSLTDLEKLVQTFDLTTRNYIDRHRQEAELSRAMGDKETAVREEIMAGVINSSRGMFAHCYTRITGLRGKLWDE